jgi:hypothetical protein
MNIFNFNDFQILDIFKFWTFLKFKQFLVETIFRIEEFLIWNNIYNWTFFVETIFKSELFQIRY